MKWAESGERARHGAEGDERRRRAAGPAHVEHIAHPVLADLEQPRPAPESARAMVAALRAHGGGRPRRLERYWPAWIACFVFGLAYTGWAAWGLNFFGFMVGIHLVLGFGLLTWTPETAAGLRNVGNFTRRRTRRG